MISSIRDYGTICDSARGRFGKLIWYLVEKKEESV